MNQLTPSSMTGAAGDGMHAPRMHPRRLLAIAAILVPCAMIAAMMFAGLPLAVEEDDGRASGLEASGTSSRKSP